MLGHLALVEETLAHAVETAIGMEGERAEITSYQAPVDLDPSPALSIVGKAKPMLKGRKVGVLVTDGADGDRLETLRDADEGVIELDARASIAQYIEAAKRQRVWDREARLSGDDT